MKTIYRRTVVAIALCTFVGSDVLFAAAPAVAQQPYGYVDGYGRADGHAGVDGYAPQNGYGYGGAAGMPQPGPGAVPGLTFPTGPDPGYQQRFVQPRFVPRRVGPTGALCGTQGSPMQAQTIMVPRPRPFVPTGPDVMTVSQPAQTGVGGPSADSGDARQGARPDAGAPPAVYQSLGTPQVGSPQFGYPLEMEELSRIEAGFYFDATEFLTPIRPVPDDMRSRRAVGRDPRMATPVVSSTSTGSGVPMPGNPGLQPQWIDPRKAAALEFERVAMEPLRQYGYTSFASDVSTFAPVDDVPVGPDYVIGPGDDLTISVWGPVDSTLVRTVDRNGRIVLPKVGDVRVWGLTFADADRLIRDQLGHYFRGFNTSVTMGRLRTVRVHVVGEVCQPGVYTLSALSTMTNALFAAGGPTKLGSLRDIRLIRTTRQIGSIDLYDFLQRGDRARDFRLESGDTIFVPTIGDVVAVAGEVKRPGIYELHGDATLADVIGMAGGVTPMSYLKRVQILRAQPSAERRDVDVDASLYYAKGDAAGNPVVHAGDLLLVHRSDPRIYNMVKVDGAVKYPGSYELKPDMHISQLVTPDRVLPEAYTDTVEIARRMPDLSTEIIPINLKKAWAGDPQQDVVLKPMDAVQIRTELRKPRTVRLLGQVVRPGAYTIADGERLSSVIERAGGYTARAYLKSAVFTRESLRRAEKERLDDFARYEEQRMLGKASTVVVGADKDEQSATQAALQAQRDAIKLIASKIVIGRMVLKLDQPAKMRGTTDDVVLEDGDELEIPEPPSSVLVVGSVRTSTSVAYARDENAEYYIKRVGGYAKDADKKETHILKADGSAISGFTDVRTIEPGDTIIVPPKQEDKIRTLPTIRDLVQTIGSALLGVAALSALGL